MRYLAILLFAALPAMAYTPQELLQGREDNPFTCDGDKCSISRADMEWVLARDALMAKLLEMTANRLQRCSGGHGA